MLRAPSLTLSKNLPPRNTTRDRNTDGEVHTQGQTAEGAGGEGGRLHATSTEVQHEHIPPRRFSKTTRKVTKKLHTK